MKTEKEEWKRTITKLRRLYPEADHTRINDLKTVFDCLVDTREVELLMEDFRKYRTIVRLQYDSIVPIEDYIKLALAYYTGEKHWLSKNELKEEILFRLEFTKRQRRRVVEKKVIPLSASV